MDNYGLVYAHVSDIPLHAKVFVIINNNLWTGLFILAGCPFET